MEHPNVLVFIKFPDPEYPTTEFINNLAYPDAELMGFYHLDDDESVQQAQADYEEEFTAELQKQAGRFEQRRVRAEFDLEFNHDLVETRQKVADRNDVDAVLIPGRVNTLGKVLVASRTTRNAEEKIATLLNTIDRHELISADLIHVADPDDPEGEVEGERVLKEMTSILTDEGIPSVQINREVRTGHDVAFELRQAASKYDLVVLGKTEQDVGDNVFGPVGDYIADEVEVPVLIVR